MVTLFSEYSMSLLSKWQIGASYFFLDFKICGIKPYFLQTDSSGYSLFEMSTSFSVKIKKTIQNVVGWFFTQHAKHFVKYYYMMKHVLEELTFIYLFIYLFI